MWDNENIIFYTPNTSEGTSPQTCVFFAQNATTFLQLEYLGADSEDFQEILITRKISL